MAADKWVVVGLGNPGPEYAETRHNAGSRCLARLARRHGIELRPHRLYSLGRGSIGGTEVVLARSRVFMNESGKAVAALLRQERVPTARLLVVCDDLDLPLGRLRLRPRGGHGGHNGLRSVIEHLGTDDFPRLRIGIGRPVRDGRPVTDPDLVAQYVLSVPTAEERPLLEEALEAACDAIEVVLAEGLDAAMNRYNP
ncbi:MAG TPA: aminoacyl-tRNA hydrolase [Dehalococcoidia bacterium]|nr:aminoacyl-tRNA hydrolase [Dehalococcoidia bacterium]